MLILSYFFSLLRTPSTLVLGLLSTLLIHIAHASLEKKLLEGEVVVLSIKKVPESLKPQKVVEGYCREEASLFIPQYIKTIIKDYYYEQPEERGNRWQCCQIRGSIRSFYARCCENKLCALFMTCSCVLIIFGMILGFYSYCVMHPDFKGCGSPNQDSNSIPPSV